MENNRINLVKNEENEPLRNKNEAQKKVRRKL